VTFFNFKTDSKGHVTVLRLKMDFIRSHDSFKCHLKGHVIIFNYFNVKTKT